MIYLDNAATTKPSLTAIEKAKKFNEDCFFNPSALYEGGLSAKKEIGGTKEFLLKSLSTVNHDVIFTSCGTESDNQAIFKCAKRGTVITSSGEHSAVYMSVTELKNRGNKVVFVSLNSDGSVNEKELLEAVENNDVSLVSIVHVNNETGAINDINHLASEIKKINKSIIFHSDGVQAYGKIKYKLGKDIDLYSVSAHKINGLKGTGALFIKKGLNLSPFIYGGGQEGGLRSGTENVFGIKVFGYAAEERFSDFDSKLNHVQNLKERFSELLDKTSFKIISGTNSSPFIISFSAIGARGEVIMHMLEGEGIVIGNGSACSSKKPFSRVIEACGYKKDVLEGVLRVSFSPENTMDEITFCASCLNEAVKKIKR